MKKLLVVFAIMAQCALPGICLAGSYSQSFKITVEIPAVIGLNVPDPDAVIQGTNSPVSMEENVTSNTETQIIEIAMVRDFQQIMMRTLVVR